MFSLDFMIYLIFILCNFIKHLYYCFYNTRWFQRYIIRNHLYYAKRMYSSLLIQCAFRCYSSKKILFLLKKHYASLLFQCCWRQYRARRRLLFLTQTKAATLIQSIIRCYLAKQFRKYLYCKLKVSIIQLWYYEKMFNWKTKNCSKIIRFVYAENNLFITN